MIDEVIQQAISMMLNSFTQEQIGFIRNVLYFSLSNYEVRKVKHEVIVTDTNLNEQIIKNFMVVKRIEGLTDRSLKAYRATIVRFVENANKPIPQIETNDIRKHLAWLEIERHNSKVTINNERRNLNTFFNFCVDEGYCKSNPCSRIKKVKEPKKIKKAFSEMEIEILRNEIDKIPDVNLSNSNNTKQYARDPALKRLRMKAIFEFLLSTGCRVSELVGAKKEDFIDESTLSVFGKGQKERYVYLNAKSVYALKEYLNVRKDKSPYLFAPIQGNRKQIEKSAIEVALRQLGEKAGVEKVHPHRFRRTCATTALHRGMRVEEIKEMLGHASLDTTMIYVNVNQEDVKTSHRKHFGG